jgi:hypothetical protein
MASIHGTFHGTSMRVSLSAIVVGLTVVAVLGCLAGTAFGVTPAKLDPVVTAYVHQHQPWVPLQVRGIERLYDGNPADTSFFVFTTIRPYTNQSEAKRICTAVADDLQTLGLPISLSVMGRPEATMTWDSAHHSCDALVPAALDNSHPAPVAHVEALIETEFAAMEGRTGHHVTDVTCQAPGATTAGTTPSYPCSYSEAGVQWTCNIRPTAATIAGHKTQTGLGTFICVHPLR